MGSTTIEQPSPPAAPTAAQNMSDYIENYPRLFQLMQQYAPQEAQMNVGLAQQYAAPMGEALRTAQEQMYPNETALANELTRQAQEGMAGEAPDWYMNKSQDYIKSLLGENVASPLGANYYTTGMMEQQKNWQDYYRNLGMSIAGRQPVYQAQPTQYTNQLGGYTAQGVAQTNASNYGSYANLYGNMYNANAQNTGNPWLNAGAGIVGMGLGGWMGNPSGFGGG